MTAKLFANRIDLISAIDKHQAARTEAERDEAHRDLRLELAERLRTEVAAMNLDNFLVRPKRRLVEQFVKAEAWTALTSEVQTQLKQEVAGLPSSIAADNLEAKQFDLLILRMQLTLLRGEPGFERMKQTVQDIARLLEEQTAIPAVAAKLTLIQEVQSAPFWDDVTVVCVATVRRGLRDLVQFIERRKRSTVITDFVDEIGEGMVIDLPGTPTGVDPDKVREKALAFLRKHQNDPALHKLKFNEPLTLDDLTTLEEIFAAEGSAPEKIEAAKKVDGGAWTFRPISGRIGPRGGQSGVIRFYEGQEPHRQSDRVYDSNYYSRTHYDSATILLSKLRHDIQTLKRW